MKMRTKLQKQVQAQAMTLAPCCIVRRPIDRPAMTTDGMVYRDITMRRVCIAHNMDVGDDEAQRCPFGMLQASLAGYMAGMQHRLAQLEGILAGLAVDSTEQHR